MNFFLQTKPNKIPNECLKFFAKTKHLNILVFIEIKNRNIIAQKV